MVRTLCSADPKLMIVDAESVGDALWAENFTHLAEFGAGDAPRSFATAYTTKSY